MCQEFARGRLPEEILRAVRIGRMTALQKPQGGIRGIVVGDFVRRLVARTVAQQLGPAVERHTSPFQFALSTKSGCECVAHIAQAMTDWTRTQRCCRWTIGAFDLISREAMLRGLSEVEGGGSVLPFVKLFYSSPSMYWWTDDAGGTHEVWQGGEQGDPLMPALYACGQHRALVHVSEELLDSERLFAFMDDVYVCCGPDRVAAIHQLLEREMWDRARIQLHQGKTQFWNRGGSSPHGWEAMTAVARVGDPTAVLWKGDSSLPPSEQGLRILGTPLGHPEYVRNQLQRVSASHLAVGADPSSPRSSVGLVVCSCTAREPGQATS